MFNKNKFILKVIFLLFICSTAFGQRFSQHPFAPGFYETHILLSDSGNIVFYVYRIPYNRFVFIKEGDVYKAGFRISIEVTDSTSKHITRQINEESFSVDKYEETNSNESYYEGLCSFSLGNGKFHLFPSISDLNSSKDLKLPDTWLENDSTPNDDFVAPLIIKQEQVKCGNDTVYKLANFNNSIPFAEENYSFFIPATDTSLNSIYAVLINNRDTVFKGIVKDSFISGLVPFECEGKIILKTSGPVKRTRNFILNNFSNKLDEGELRFILSKNSSFKDSVRFNMDVRWFNKPFSLMNPTDAIKLLKYIEKPSVIDSLLSFSKEKYEQELMNYWKKFDPKSHSKYNPLMEEYYSRIDYAMNNFSALSEKNGAQTDRGKTYIKYGTPKKIERTSDRDGKMVEKWIYAGSNLVFEFIDQNGAGNYTLKK